VLRPAGTAIDKSWGELFQEFTDAREAWRNNPLARRIVGLTTAYTVSTGLRLTTTYRPLQRFIDDFWQSNQMTLLVDEWSDELTRSGELFPVLFTNPISGISQVRTVPAQLIEAIEFDAEDYTRELRFKETTTFGADPSQEKWWLGPGTLNVETLDVTTPLMLHYAVNRPVGALRGESDLAAILPWLKRYNRWLEDRVRLNAAMRAFLWIVHAPARLRATLEERYRTPPEAGTVIIAEQDAETWEAVTPGLHAADAEKDGRAIRWMIVAGGPGTALIDIGEGEDANLATAKVMTEQRQRFLRRRQNYLGWMLTDLTIHAWGRYLAVVSATEGNEHTENSEIPRPGALWARHESVSNGARKTRLRRVRADEINVIAPDISPDDNQALATAANQLAGALASLAVTVGQGAAFRRVALRMFAKFAGESLSDQEMQQILEEGASHVEKQ
jgi:hypothetical protein